MLICVPIECWRGLLAIAVLLMVCLPLGYLARAESSSESRLEGGE
jgi:hypothetical protein